jgi:hypothetical protein
MGWVRVVDGRTTGRNGVTTYTSPLLFFLELQKSLIWATPCVGGQVVYGSKYTAVATKKELDVAEKKISALLKEINGRELRSRRSVTEADAMPSTGTRKFVVGERGNYYDLTVILHRCGLEGQFRTMRFACPRAVAEDTPPLDHAKGKRALHLRFSKNVRRQARFFT